MQTRSLKTLLALATVSTLGMAQHAPRTHQGFYLSGGLGPASGDTTVSGGGITIGGQGLQFDFRIGGAVARNLILSFDLGGRAASNPSVSGPGGSGTARDSTMSDALAGAGLTYYFPESNIFIGATVGRAAFSFTHAGVSSSTEAGTGVQVRAGKEWWVSSRWAIGFQGGVAHLSARDSGYNAPTFKTTKVFLAFSATFN